VEEYTETEKDNSLFVEAGGGEVKNTVEPSGEQIRQNVAELWI
jgi:hypothetical protein